MKPLELIAYPLDSTFPRGYVLPRDTRITFRAAERMARAKRFTNTELAAEYWRAATIDTTHWAADDDASPQGVRAIEQTMTFKRFATLPHYDEVDS